MAGDEPMLGLLGHDGIDDFSIARNSTDNYLENLRLDQLTPEIPRKTPGAWYMTPNHRILLGDDGKVQGGTLKALVEHLTIHDRCDTVFLSQFMATYKMFTTTDDLFGLLVERFGIAPPERMNTEELEDWEKRKRTPMKLRVINILRKILYRISIENEPDSPVLHRINSFAESVQHDVPGAAQLVDLVGRIQATGSAQGFVACNTVYSAPPPSAPRLFSFSIGKPQLRLLDIDTLELARQLTLTDSQQFKAIKSTEILERMRNPSIALDDNIQAVYSTTSEITNWVIWTVLRGKDPRRRGVVIKYFISLAKRCHALNNHASFNAVTTGLKCPAIQRLKRSWDAVSTRSTKWLDDAAIEIGPECNFFSYERWLETVEGPCVPLIVEGVLDVVLKAFVSLETHYEDFLPKRDVINFEKWRKVAEILQLVQLLQQQSFFFTSVDSIQRVVSQSLVAVDKTIDPWSRSLQVEPPKESKSVPGQPFCMESGLRIWRSINICSILCSQPSVSGLFPPSRCYSPYVVASDSNYTHNRLVELVIPPVHVSFSLVNTYDLYVSSK
ncbi:hypothetical protein FRC10_007564 [Ceratobasidium sp. 414]|nr:hypothetical protein FRC10_007564 [Ceratobasidium sp. 414]